MGRFCQIAHGVRFITASANHAMAGFTTYPFPIFDPALLDHYKGSFTGLPDTLIGPDVWIGHGALILGHNHPAIREAVIKAARNPDAAMAGKLGDVVVIHTGRM